MPKKNQYTVIKTKAQYDQYCKDIYGLLKKEKQTDEDKKIIELLTMLIERYDEEHDTFEEYDPIEFVQSLMRTHQMGEKELAKLIGEAEDVVAEILERRTRLSKKHAKALAKHFCVQEDALNRPYLLDSSASTKQKHVGIISLAE